MTHTPAVPPQQKWPSTRAPVDPAAQRAPAAVQLFVASESSPSRTGRSIVLSPVKPSLRRQRMLHRHRPPNRGVDTNPTSSFEKFRSPVGGSESRNFFGTPNRRLISLHPISLASTKAGLPTRQL
ncbi:unnamed protein product [Linum trigynum]|uniref:Uncharacterized protein n=1 Tax=Linum trigynum TaxID=586398 RepID=A0AAV2E0G9_9ROSI